MWGIRHWSSCIIISLCIIYNILHFRLFDVQFLFGLLKASRFNIFLCCWELSRTHVHMIGTGATLLLFINKQSLQSFCNTIHMVSGRFSTSNQLKFMPINIGHAWIYVKLTKRLYGWCYGFKTGHISLSCCPVAKDKCLLVCVSSSYIVTLSPGYVTDIQHAFWMDFSPVTSAWTIEQHIDPETMMHMVMSPNTCPNLAGLFCWQATSASI